jgi:anhydro-N-acetylmuramic acid kinase
MIMEKYINDSLSTSSKLDSARIAAKEIILPILENYPISVKDKMRTFTEHIAFQTGKILQHKTGKLLISGGGVYNDFLIERIQFYKPEIHITIPDTTLLEYKEALIFGLLGVLKLRNEINVLSSVTGAKKDHSTGKIYSKSV